MPFAWPAKQVCTVGPTGGREGGQVTAGGSNLEAPPLSEVKEKASIRC